jgi:hypothetical protein
LKPSRVFGRRWTRESRLAWELLILIGVLAGVIKSWRVWQNDPERRLAA